MSLREAILNTAYAIEEEVKNLALDRVFQEKNPTHYVAFRFLLLGYVRELRAAAKASENDSHSGILSEASKQENELMAKARKEFQNKNPNKRMQLEESDGGMAELVGHPDANTPSAFVPIDPQMPVGARTFFDGSVWVFREDRRLHYDAEATKQYFEQQGNS